MHGQDDPQHQHSHHHQQSQHSECLPLVDGGAVPELDVEGEAQLPAALLALNGDFFVEEGVLEVAAEALLVAEVVAFAEGDAFLMGEVEAALLTLLPQPSAPLLGLVGHETPLAAPRPFPLGDLGFALLCHFPGNV